MVPETKGLSLEQVDQMLEETTPITSSRWVPHYTFADEATRADVAKATGVTKHTEDTEHTRRLGNGIEFLEFNSIVEGKGE